MEDFAGLDFLQQASHAYWSELMGRCDTLISLLTNDSEVLVKSVAEMKMRESIVSATQTYYTLQQTEIRKIYKQIKKHVAPVVPMPRTVATNLLIAEYCLYKNMEWYESFYFETGIKWFPDKTLNEFKKVHALVAATRIEGPGQVLEWLVERGDIVKKEIRALVILSGSLTIVKKYFEFVKDIPLCDLLLVNASPEWQQCVEFIWRAFGRLEQVAETVVTRLDPIASVVPEVLEKTCYADYEEVICFTKEELPQLTNCDIPLIGEAPLFPPDLDDDTHLVTPNFDRSSFSSPRSTSLLELSAQPRLYPYNQSRDWMINQLVARSTGNSVEDLPRVTAEVPRGNISYLPRMSRLEAGLLAGFEAWPRLWHWRKTTKTTDSLGVEIDLPTLMAHSFIVCPVSRQPCRVPQLLVCGHVVSEESLASMVQARKHLKCPLCPQEISHDSTRSINI